MEPRAITAAVVALMNERLEAIPRTVYRSQTQFMKAAARLAGVSQGNMRALMTGETPSLRLDYLYALAAALGEDPLELLAEAERRYVENPPAPVVPDEGAATEAARRTDEQASRLSRLVQSKGEAVQDKPGLPAAPLKVSSTADRSTPKGRPHAI